MHPFSIDYITREAPDCNVREQSHIHHDTVTNTTNNGRLSAEHCRLTPSPTDSGMESDHSSTHSPHDVETESIAETLLALGKMASRRLTGQSDDTADEKPTHSYIALISLAILSSPDRKMLLCDIYQYIMDSFSYYNNEEKAWRNSIRHNLSLNECFIKSGRAVNGKGNYWCIHPACEDNFSKGDFRRRQARIRAKKSIKQCSATETSPYHRYNVGYVPMTPSHIGYHPYGATTSSIYYPQSSYSSFVQTPITSSASISTSSSLPNGYSQHHLPGYYPSCTQSSSAISTAAAQRLFAEQTTASVNVQTLAQQCLPSSFQRQNWCQENF